MDFLAIIFSSLVLLALLTGYFLYLTRPQKKEGRAGSRVDLSIISGKWQEVESMLASGGPANYKQAIMDGDKLVDLALKSKVPGETMGERLKNAKRLFSAKTYNDLWTAHKIRNKIAHEADFEGLGSDARLAVGHFKKALRELKQI